MRIIIDLTIEDFGDLPKIATQKRAPENRLGQKSQSPLKKQCIRVNPPTSVQNSSSSSTKQPVFHRSFTVSSTPMSRSDNKKVFFVGDTTHTHTLISSRRQKRHDQVCLSERRESCYDERNRLTTVFYSKIRRNYRIVHTNQRAFILYNPCQRRSKKGNRRVSIQLDLCLSLCMLMLMLMLMMMMMMMMMVSSLDSYQPTIGL